MSNPSFNQDWLAGEILESCVTDLEQAQKTIKKLEGELGDLRQAVEELAVADGGTGGTYDEWTKVETLLGWHDE
jgi:hypothetical protein